jgi:hypothetical protein
MLFSVNQQFLVLVGMPKKASFSEWGTVALVTAIGQEEAIEKAIRETPALTEYVAPGIMRFMAVPVRGVPIKRASVVGQELVL